jgi:hypothetical protein
MARFRACVAAPLTGIRAYADCPHPALEMPKMRPHSVNVAAILRHRVAAAPPAGGGEHATARLAERIDARRVIPPLPGAASQGPALFEMVSTTGSCG